MKTALDWVNNKTAPAMSQKSQDTTQKQLCLVFFGGSNRKKRNAAKRLRIERNWNWIIGLPNNGIILFILTSNDWFDKKLICSAGQLAPVILFMIINLQ